MKVIISLIYITACIYNNTFEIIKNNKMVPFDTYEGVYERSGRVKTKYTPKMFSGRYVFI